MQWWENEGNEVHVAAIQVSMACSHRHQNAPRRLKSRDRAKCDHHTGATIDKRLAHLEYTHLREQLGFLGGRCLVDAMDSQNDFVGSGCDEALTRCRG